MKIPPHGEHSPTIVNGKKRQAFVPGPLSELPPLNLAALASQLGETNRAIGGLRGIGNFLPNTDHFLDGCVRREAVYSSQIEGTQSSLEDLLLDEGGGSDGQRDRRPPKLNDDRAETSNYVKALNHGLKRLRAPEPEGLPLSLRLLRELHAILLQSGRGAEMGPGEFRQNQNWVGNHIPPPPNRVAECMGELEKFVAAPTESMDPLIRAGLAHAQFETIHPFRDGNGRIGRLLVILMLVNEGALDEPWLYLSLPVKQTRGEYYARLDSTRASGDWTDWLLYFLRVIAEAAAAADQTARDAADLFRRDAKKMATRLGIQRPSLKAVHQVLQRFPISSITRLTRESNFSYPAVKTALDHLLDLGIVHLLDERKWGRRFVYREYMDLLQRDDAPL